MGATLSVPPPGPPAPLGREFSALPQDPNVSPKGTSFGT
jgi:hypothetical protein